MPEASLTIFLDIIDSAIAGTQSAQVRRYASRLLVDGDEIPIRSATLEARKDSLGTELRVVLAEADTTQVDFDSVITFQIGLWTGAAFAWVSLLAGGKLSSLENPIRNESGRPADSVSISVVDVIADRWNRAPRTPVHLYDSDQLDAPDQSAIAAGRIELQDGSVILPVNVPIAGMTLQNVLDAAYVDGTGFSAVVTNLPDFPVPETDFTLSGGYDAGVRPLLTLFAPMLFERDNVLFVIDPDGPLPSGFAARSFPQSSTRELTDSLPQREPVNSLLLRYKSDAAGEYFTTRTDSNPPTTSGDFGTPSWTSTSTEKTIREYRNTAAPDIIVREEEAGETTTVVDFEFNPIEITTLTQSFDAMNRKTGHVRRVSKRLPDLNNDGVMTLLDDVTVQNQTITYRPNPLNAAQDVQDVVSTVESGLIVVDPDNQYLDHDYKIPLTDAHVTGYVDPSSGQHVESGDIRTTTEALRVRGQQVDVEIRVVNHLANAPVQTSLSTRPGVVSTSRQQQAASRTKLLIVEGTDGLGRRAQVFDAGLLPTDIAIELGERKLRRLNDSPRQLSLSPAYLDVTIKRGSLLEIHGRDDESVGVFIVEGYSINFAEFQPETGAPVSMNVTCREIKE